MTATEMTCLEVRDLLPELAVGVLDAEERGRVERHLRWCAGCRKESAELGNAAATFAFALAPALVPHGLRERVVEGVRRAAGAPGTSRRFRTTAAAIVAAFVAVASLGWGAVMAGRAERFETRAKQAELEQREALEQFRKVLAGVVPSATLPTNDTHLAPLSPTPDGQGAGAVLELVSPTMIDFSIVIVNGFEPEAPDRLPYRVRLVNANGNILRAGIIRSIDDQGGADVYHQFDAKSLSGYTTVRVLDAHGVVVLEGDVDQQS
jgi:Putative zinc-finger